MFEVSYCRIQQKEQNKVQVVEVIKANYKLGSGIFYYITFVAEDKDVGSTKNFQAFVRFRFKRPTIQFCRLEKPPNEVVEYNFKYVRKEEDPNKPKKPSPALFWFFQEFTKTYKEKHPNASDDAVGHACGGAWTSMNKAAKAPYVQIAEKKMAEYHKNLEAYNKRLAEGWVEEEESDNLRSEVNDKDEDDERVEE
ncbi:HMG1/2-like protein isoform X1 [Rhododendron vialii]|uniref:HMG1/2-like protein isoform X1 n=1 Tax=Rhododendron vialii TaxID=182163 RepID=UPI00265E2910|nr:HMG1/2-like protein isoform X1 [Rhododendron vialii]